MTNRGAAPPTDLAGLRALLGDLDYKELDPAEPGFGDYEMFSDAELEAFLEQADGSLEGAAYYAYLQLASHAALESRSVKDYDLQIDLTKRSGDLLRVAEIWRVRWDSQTSDIFELFDVGSTPRRVPELSPPWGV